MARSLYPFSAANAIGEFSHLIKHGVNFRHDILAIHKDACSFRRS
jgi:hypothetical protein